MKVIKDAQALRDWALTQKAAGRRIGLVPTMGFLHAGHLSLVKLARQRSDAVVATSFVNPTQFGPGEDFGRYPRDEQGDLDKLEHAGAEVAFVPDAAQIYPAGFDTYVTPENLAARLCGASRPGHFRGVCTVVHVLLRLSLCDVAIFGEKDFQQLQIIRRMVKDLWLDVGVVGGPIVREADGLAMSSRNVYLSPSERVHAQKLSQAVAKVSEAFAFGEVVAARLLAIAAAVLRSAPALRVDYVEIVDRETLQPLSVIDRPARICIAAFVGNTRLIDNGPLEAVTVTSGPTARARAGSAR